MIERRIARLVEVIETGNEPVAALAARLAPLDRERVALAERLRVVQADTNVIELHPTTLQAVPGESGHAAQDLRAGEDRTRPRHRRPGHDRGGDGASDREAGGL